MSGDRYIIRRFSPLLTIGGGEVLDPSPRRRKRKDGYKDLKVLEQGSLEEKLSTKIFHSGINGLTLSDLEGWIKAEMPDISGTIKSLIKNNEVIQIEDRILHGKVFNNFSRKVILVVRDFHKKNPLRPGMPKENLRADFKWLDFKFFETLLANVRDIKIEKENIRLETYKISLSDDNRLLKDKILEILKRSSFQPPMKEELASRLFGIINNKELDELLKIMASEGNLVRINDSLYLSSASYKKMIESLKGFFKTKPEITVGEFRDILGTSRKYALPFFEYLDSNKITLRVGDVRKFLIKP
jgi:selenocysteine-specific elongation factor